MTHRPMLKSPNVGLLLIVMLMIPSLSAADPAGSKPTMKPGTLSLGLSSNTFVSFNGSLYIADTRSSNFPIAQTYPEPNVTTNYATSPLSMRLSPSVSILADGWVKLIQLNLEYTLRTNLQNKNHSAVENLEVEI